jgi:hypothetical protein
MRYPVKVMSDRVNAILNGTEQKHDLRYVMYSAHDTQVANLLEYLNLTDFDYYYIPYASNIYFELHYD